ncbi:hypothetical protein OsI_33189 [Oryza sativa Indica Group]|uniref:Uncharacterized protein n=1 Tax=Oryza sativa subsp. indica TaxID=39946 RepID=B8BGE0_ORYSI|nr:hypothetical protein OsI_33189 [Oryza sativa Indica Group]
MGPEISTTDTAATSGGCDFWEWHDPESDPYWKQLLLDLRNAVWTAREEINGLKAHLQDSRNEALKNRAVSRSKESNELESLRAALEQIEATNCVLVDRITQQQKCMNMLMYALAFAVVVLVGAMSISGHNMPSSTTQKLSHVLDYRSFMPYLTAQKMLFELPVACLLSAENGLCMLGVAKELMQIVRNNIGSSSKIEISLEETFSSSSLLQMISMSPETLHHHLP